MFIVIIRGFVRFVESVWYYDVDRFFYLDQSFSFEIETAKPSNFFSETIWILKPESTADLHIHGNFIKTTRATPLENNLYSSILWSSTTHPSSNNPLINWLEICLSHPCRGYSSFSHAIDCVRLQSSVHFSVMKNIPVPHNSDQQPSVVVAKAHVKTLDRTTARV